MAWGDSSYLDKEISSDALGRFFRPIEERQKTAGRGITNKISIISPLLNRYQKGAGAYGTRTGNSALNKTTGKTFPVTPLPKARQAIIDAGGLIPCTRNRLLETATATFA